MVRWPTLRYAAFAAYALRVALFTTSTYTDRDITRSTLLYKYTQWLDAILTDLKKAGYIISNIKSQFYKSKIVIIGYLYNSDGLLKALKYNRYITKTGTKRKKKCI